MTWQDQTVLVLPPSPIPTPPFGSCSDLLKQINQYDGAGPDSPNSPYSQLSAFISDVKNMSAKDRLDTIKQLRAQQKQANDIINSQLRKDYDLYKSIQDVKVNPSLSPAEKEKAINDLLTGVVTNYLNQLGASNLRYLPQNTTITVCLNVRYDGANNAVATITEKDFAQLPLLGQIGVPSCQAQLITPINAAGPGNLLWPTDKRSISGNGYTANHTGIDIAGTAGTPIKSSTSGTIIKEGNDPASRDKNGVLLSLGNYIIMQGDDGNYYLYGHLGDNVHTDGAFIKNVGDKVNAGDSIGYIGNSGITTGETGVHLHFGVSTTASGVGASDFYNNSTTTLNPCGFFQGGCP